VDAEDIALGIIDAFGGELAEGRTYLQKAAYFAADALGVKAGYEPHYYGPYSRLVSAEVDAAASKGLLSEVREDFGAPSLPGQFERVRYTYKLTKEGEEYVRFLKGLDKRGFARLAEIVERMRQIGADYRQLSCAAKVDYLVAKAGGTITRADAKSKAKECGWRLSDPDINTAVEILKQLGRLKARKRAKPSTRQPSSA
jgi:uncharacterized protein YwgA